MNNKLSYRRDRFTTVSGVSYASVYTNRLTTDSVVTYLFHDCERSLIILPSVSPASRIHWSAMIKVQFTLSCCASGMQSYCARVCTV